MRRSMICAFIACVLMPLTTVHADGWRDSLTGVKIPDSPAKGRIRGTNLVVEGAELRGAHLHLRQGKEFFADREFVILLRGPQASLQGKKYTVVEDQGFGGGAPSVHLSWKVKGASLPKTRIYMEDYLMRLVFGRLQNGRMPGKIYLCIPDFKRSYVAGSFVAMVK